AAAAVAAEHVRLFGAAVGLPDRAARRRDPDLDAPRRTGDGQVRREIARLARGRPDGRVTLHDDRLCHRPAVAAGDHERHRPGIGPWPHLLASAEPGVRNAGAAYTEHAS